MPGECAGCVCVGSIRALVEHVVDERRGVVGFVKVKVDDAMGCLLVGGRR